MSTSVYYKGSKLIDVNNNTKTLLTSGKYLEGDVTLIDTTSSPSVSSLTVTPTNSQQTFDATGVYGYKPVTIEAVPSASIGVGVSSGFTDTFGERAWRYQPYYNVTSAGWVSSGIVSSTVTVLRAISSGTTITPTTTNKTVGGSNWMMESAITVLGDANLVASNIADGVSIFGISGTHQGGGGGYTIDDIAMKTVSGGVSGNATSIGYYAFYSFRDLTTASFSLCTSIGSNAFGNCSNLTTISFPACTTISNYAFEYCSRLTTISFPLCTSIGNYAFAYCYSLTTASFSLCLTVSNYAFRNCHSLTTISFPSCTTVGNYAFYDCSNLTTISFPLCTSIGSNAFRSCYNLLSLYLLGSSVPTLSASVFTSTPIDGYTTSTGGVYGSIFVPSSLYNSYITATNWSLYSARIVSV